MKKNINSIIEEDLIIMPGVGATKSVGSDCYPYYVSEVLANNVVGIYEPKSHFDDLHPWEGGHLVVDKYDSSHKPDIYIKRRYGSWWECTKDGKPLNKMTCKYVHLKFGHAISYQNPSF